MRLSRKGKGAATLGSGHDKPSSLPAAVVGRVAVVGVGRTWENAQASPAGGKPWRQETTMTQENEHIRTLIAARGREIEQRRNAAKTLAQQYIRGDTEYLRENFVKIQDTIEAINRAIADEEVIESREPRSSSPTPIGFGNR
jgi:hypothetical protein